MQLLFATAVLFRVQGRIYVFVATIQVPHAGDCVGWCIADAAQCIILIGVLVMSGSKCGLFLEALDEEGALTYFFGLVAARHATAMQANDLEAGPSCCTTRQL